MCKGCSQLSARSKKLVLCLQIPAPPKLPDFFYSITSWPDDCCLLSSPRFLLSRQDITAQSQCWTTNCDACRRAFLFHACVVTSLHVCLMYRKNTSSDHATNNCDQIRQDSFRCCSRFLPNSTDRNFKMYIKDLCPRMKL